jgi:hypothetical protein
MQAWGAHGGHYPTAIGEILCFDQEQQGMHGTLMVLLHPTRSTPTLIMPMPIPNPMPAIIHHPQPSTSLL